MKKLHDIQFNLCSVIDCDATGFCFFRLRGLFSEDRPLFATLLCLNVAEERDFCSDDEIIALMQGEL